MGSTYEKARAMHLWIDGKLKCRQMSFYPLDTTTDITKVTCQYCLRGPKLKKESHEIREAENKEKG